MHSHHQRNLCPRANTTATINVYLGTYLNNIACLTRTTAGTMFFANGKFLMKGEILTAVTDLWHEIFVSSNTSQGLRRFYPLLDPTEGVCKRAKHFGGMGLNILALK